MIDIYPAGSTVTIVYLDGVVEALEAGREDEAQTPICVGQRGSFVGPLRSSYSVLCHGEPHRYRAGWHGTTLTTVQQQSLL